MARVRVLRLVLQGALLGPACAMAQTSPAYGPLPSAGAASAGQSMPMADYLGLLEQIAPAAATGARTYLAAVQLRCHRTLSTEELRIALSQGEGDPALLGLIRAAHTQDLASRERWIAQVACPPRGLK